MLKSRPLLISAIIFGSIGLVLTAIAAWIFVSGDTEFTKWLSMQLQGNQNSITSSTLAQLGIVFELSSIMIAGRALDDEA